MFVRREKYLLFEKNFYIFLLLLRGSDPAFSEDIILLLRCNGDSRRWDRVESAQKKSITVPNDDDSYDGIIEEISPNS